MPVRIDLLTVISFDGFDYDSRTYYQQEKDILQPRLEALGYKKVTWSHGERDDFGPLIRKCDAYKDGKLVHFFYG